MWFYKQMTFIHGHGNSVYKEMRVFHFHFTAMKIWSIIALTSSLMYSFVFLWCKPCFKWSSLTHKKIKVTNEKIRSSHIWHILYNWVYKIRFHYFIYFNVSLTPSHTCILECTWSDIRSRGCEYRLTHTPGIVANVIVSLKMSTTAAATGNQTWRSSLSTSVHFAAFWNTEELNLKVSVAHCIEENSLNTSPNSSFIIDQS